MRQTTATQPATSTTQDEASDTMVVVSTTKARRSPSPKYTPPSSSSSRPTRTSYSAMVDVDPACECAVMRTEYTERGARFAISSSSSTESASGRELSNFHEYCCEDRYSTVSLPMGQPIETSQALG